MAHQLPHFAAGAAAGLNALGVTGTLAAKPTGTAGMHRARGEVQYYLCSTRLLATRGMKSWHHMATHAGTTWHGMRMQAVPKSIWEGEHP